MMVEDNISQHSKSSHEDNRVENDAFDDRCDQFAASKLGAFALLTSPSQFHQHKPKRV